MTTPQAYDPTECPGGRFCRCTRWHDERRPASPMFTDSSVPIAEAPRRVEIEASKGFMIAAGRLSSLYSMTSDFQRLLNLLEDEYADVEDINAEMERLAGDIQTKAFGVANVMQSLKNMAELQRAEVRRMEASARQTEAHVERFEQYVINAMRNIPGLVRLETGTYTLAIRLNNPKIEIVDPAAIPAAYWRQPPIPALEPDKTALLNHWRATGGRSTPDGVTGGQCIPGTEVVRGERLAIS